jgi:hypothetical protein
MVMSDLSEKDKMQISAETARKNMASKAPIEDIIKRIDKWNGAGINPSEVLALRNYIDKLENRILIDLGSTIE